MKILNPLRFYKGYGGGGGKTSIPALVPPDRQSLLKSISIAETVDLICEGPIYGLVDQFGKKVYGLDMLKGIYLNKVPVMNYDGKYNFRNVVMEINLGTENQTPLQNFNNVYIWRPANFKLLGPITTNQDIRPAVNGGSSRNFTEWATGWPTDAKDPFVYVHHVKNKDVKKIRVSLIVEALFDTVDQGKSDGSAGTMGMSKSTNLTIVVTCGVEGTNKIFTKQYELNGTVQSPYACMLGEPLSQFDSSSSSGAASSVAGGLINTNSFIVGSIGARTVGLSSDMLETLKPITQTSN